MKTIAIGERDALEYKLKKICIHHDFIKKVEVKTKAKGNITINVQEKYSFMKVKMYPTKTIRS